MTVEHIGSYKLGDLAKSFHKRIPHPTLETFEIQRLANINNSSLKKLPQCYLKSDQAFNCFPIFEGRKCRLNVVLYLVGVYVGFDKWVEWFKGLFCLAKNGHCP